MTGTSPLVENVQVVVEVFATESAFWIAPGLIVIVGDWFTVRFARTMTKFVPETVADCNDGPLATVIRESEATLHGDWEVMGNDIDDRVEESTVVPLIED
jgi:hypothetical protein